MKDNKPTKPPITEIIKFGNAADAFVVNAVTAAATSAKNTAISAKNAMVEACLPVATVNNGARNKKEVTPIAPVVATPAIGEQETPVAGGTPGDNAPGATDQQQLPGSDTSLPGATAQVMAQEPELLGKQKNPDELAVKQIEPKVKTVIFSEPQPGQGDYGDDAPAGAGAADLKSDLPPAPAVTPLEPEATAQVVSSELQLPREPISDSDPAQGVGVVGGSDKDMLSKLQLPIGALQRESISEEVVPSGEPNFKDGDEVSQGYNGDSAPGASSRLWNCMQSFSPFSCCYGNSVDIKGGSDAIKGGSDEFIRVEETPSTDVWEVTGKSIGEDNTNSL